MQHVPTVKRFAKALSVLMTCILPACVSTQHEQITVGKREYNVLDFGVVGDGATDNTAAFQEALDAVGAAGGGVVKVPTGQFLIRGHLNVPRDVALQGVWQGPNRGPAEKGSTLLAIEGQGNPEGPPFISLTTNSMLRGLTIHYPEQIEANPPHAYPWTVRGEGDNCTIVDVLMTNPYQAVDFGTKACGRHYINGLYAQALYRGIFVDQCFDIGRIQNVHLWPFWKDSPTLHAFVREKGIGFIFGRTDWEYVNNSFCIFYNVGFLFTEFESGPGNVLLTQSGSDIGPCAVRVERVQDHSGISFSNCQMMATVEVLPSNKGPVKFTACGFWPIKETAEQARLAGGGHVFFEGCHFSDWDIANQGAPCIQADCDGLTVTGCDLMATGKNQITLGPNLNAAVITANRLRGGVQIDDQSQGDVQIGLNTK
ncbi:MAG: hypothetical protein HY706_06785 [Candidatus Hydrogenedentes bacterium]|nr:hypothetical protein [Candidatus Hydrogenedentota bacterium]